MKSLRRIVLLAVLCFLGSLSVWNSRWMMARSSILLELQQPPPDANLPVMPPNDVSYFERAADLAYGKIRHQDAQQLQRKQHNNRPAWNLATWPHRSNGGLRDPDRLVLAETYRQAGAVFEFGLGESTRIADAVGVPRYAGIDSDPAWIAQTRAVVAPHFRFYWADIGAVVEWGYPAQPDLAKNIWHYQVAPLWSEPEAFDVYMVDGRWRAALVVLCFLHASSRRQTQPWETSHLSTTSTNTNTNSTTRNNNNNNNNNSSTTTTTITPPPTTVLLHDCPKPGISPDRMYERLHRNVYDRIDSLLQLVHHSGNLLCVYQRKNTTTDHELWELWKELHTVVE